MAIMAKDKTIHVEVDQVRTKPIKTCGDRIQRQKLRFLLSLSVAISVSFRLWLVSSQNLTALAGTVYDDRLFLTIAESILNGRWLGEYGYVTLVKGPFYPLWIGMVSLGGIPLLLAEHIFYILACAGTAYALSPLFYRHLTTFLIFVVLLFNPMSYTTGVMTQVLREGIYPALTMFVFACMIGLILRFEKGYLHLIVWSVSLGFALSALWLTREEGMWIVPSMLILLVGSVVLFFRDKLSVKRKLLLFFCIPLLVTFLIIKWVMLINLKLYGIDDVTEVKSPAFLSAYGSLMRVEHTDWKPTVPVPQDVRDSLYRECPAFNELKPFLTGGNAQRWIDIFTSIKELYFTDINFARKINIYLESDTNGLWRDIILKDNQSDIHGGWFIWAFRHAVAAAGYYQTGKISTEYYRKLSKEINEACRDGRIKCGSERASLIPPWHWEYTIPLLKTTISGIGSIAAFRGFDIDALPSMGDEKSLEIFSQIAGEKLVPHEFRITGWVTGSKFPVTFTIMTRDAVPVGIPIHISPSSGVYDSLPSSGIDTILNSQKARFDIKKPLIGEFSVCMTGCDLLIEDGNHFRKKITLDGSMRSIAEDVLHLEIESLVPSVSDNTKGDIFKIKIMKWFGSFYQGIVTVLSISSVIGYFLLTVQFMRKKLKAIYWIVLTSLLVAILTRILLLALIQVTSFITIIPQYLSPLYPLELLFIMIVLVVVSEIFPRRRGWTAAPGA